MSSLKEAIVNGVETVSFDEWNYLCEVFRLCAARGDVDNARLTVARTINYAIINVIGDSADLGPDSVVACDSEWDVCCGDAFQVMVPYTVCPNNGDVFGYLIDLIEKIVHLAKNKQKTTKLVFNLDTILEKHEIKRQQECQWLIERELSL